MKNNREIVVRLPEGPRDILFSNRQNLPWILLILLFTEYIERSGREADNPASSGAEVNDERTSVLVLY
jgi:hypothetical protein